MGLLEDLIKLARAEGAYLISFAINSEVNEAAIDGMTGTPHGTATWRVRSGGDTLSDALEKALLLIPEARQKKVADMREAASIRASFRAGPKAKPTSAAVKLDAADLLKKLGLT